MYFEPITNTKIQLEKMGWLVNKHQDGQHVDIDTKGLPKTEEFAAALLSDGFYVAQQMLAAAPSESRSWSEFRQYWDRLTTDEYMKDNGTYRKRRYSTMYYAAQANTVVRKPYMPLYKSNLYNSFAGNVFRYFDETESGLFENTHFKRALSLALTTFNHCQNLLGSAQPQWFVEVDQYRIVADNTRVGKPAPEGVHSDGTSYFLLMLVEKTNVEGGVSSIYDQDMELACTTTLQNPGDIMLLDDTRMLHGVSDLYSQLEGGHRDILHLSFTNLNSLHAIERRFGLNQDELEHIKTAKVNQWTSWHL